MSLALHLAVRFVHVASAAVLVGGAALVWARTRIAPPVTGEETPGLGTAVAYEWLFWGAMGLVVLTGVGNLGALAPAVPGPRTDWGRTLAVKLSLVLVLLLGSAVRSLAVLRLQTAATTAGDERGRVLISRLYAATTAVLLALVALAEVLAHG